jgi:hypothetical protein
MNARNNNAMNPVFHQGAEVVRARGSYQGTPGIFCRLKSDPAWADVAERGGAIRSHPLEWLGHSKPSGGTQAGAVE